MVDPKIEAGATPVQHEKKVPTHSAVWLSFADSMSPHAFDVKGGEDTLGDDRVDIVIFGEEQRARKISAFAAKDLAVGGQGLDGGRFRHERHHEIAAFSEFALHRNFPADEVDEAFDDG